MRRIHLLLLAAAAAVLATAVATAAPPAARAETAAPTVRLAVSTFELDNGLRVILHPDPSSPSVVVYLWYHVGSKDEQPGRSGFAHLFEHLMFKGSRHVPDGAFDQLIESAGGWNNGTTSADRTNYFMQLPSSFLELGLYLEADRLAGLWDAMNQEVLDNQRDVVKNERRQSYENAPYGKARLLVQQALWPAGHGNHNLTIGHMEDLAAASLADVERFYRTYYTPGNATLVLAGDFDPAHARALVTRYFGWMPRRPTPPHVTLTAPVTPREGQVRLVDHDRVQVPKVTVAWRSPTPLAGDDAALDLAARLLTDGKTSRLHQRLVFDETLATSVMAYQYGMTLGGEFQIHALAREGVSPDQILAVIDEEVARLAGAPPSDDELTRAKRMREAEVLNRLEGLVARADRLAQYQAYTGTADYLARELATYEALTAADVQRAVATWLAPDARVVMFIVPQSEAGTAGDAGAAKETP